MKAIKIPELRLNTEFPISKQIYNFLRHLITVNTINPGTRLSENILSAHFKVSRQPVREALFQLKRCGFIEIFPQIGSYVKKISLVNIQEICFVRSSIEINSVVEGLKKNDRNFKDVMARISGNLEEQNRMFRDESIKDRDAVFLELDDEFHRLLCSLSGVNLAWDTIQEVKANLDRIRYLSTQRVSKIDNLIAQHQHIRDLIAANRTDEACEALRAHLFEINETSIPICLENYEWFDPEDVARLRGQYPGRITDG